MVSESIGPDVDDLDRRLFDGFFTVRALRDSRYNNTAYALAELIDNSIEAKASRVDLLCAESSEVVTQRSRRGLDFIAVADNGTGMDFTTLLNALKFGHTANYNRPRGISKYGMGLPTASMSQSKRVDIWTWQDGIESYFHSSIDADNIEAGDHQVPIPDRITPIPEMWRQAVAKEILDNKTGTLVVWSSLDKIKWRQGRTVIDHCQREIGRIHRMWLNQGLVQIRGATFLVNGPQNISFEEIFVPNDPMYLMSPSTTPYPWNELPMFEEEPPDRYNISIAGKSETVTVRYSIVRSEVLEPELSANRNPGGAVYGQHALKNIGVSVLREEREIVLEERFRRLGGETNEPQNRWWGVQVEFGRGLDEFFGVDHNKQMVSNFTQAVKDLGGTDQVRQSVLEDFMLEDDGMYRIVDDIRARIRSMRARIDLMYKNMRRRQPASEEDEGPTPARDAELSASERHHEEIAQGQPKSRTDIERENMQNSERQELLTQAFVDEGQAKSAAERLALETIASSRIFHFASKNLRGDEMFDVERKAGILHVGLNMNHELHRHISLIEDELNSSDVDVSGEPLWSAAVIVRLLLLGWAQMEDYAEPDSRVREIQRIANEWGKQVNKFLERRDVGDVPGEI